MRDMAIYIVLGHSIFENSFHRVSQRPKTRSAFANVTFEPTPIPFTAIEVWRMGRFNKRQ